MVLLAELPVLLADLPCALLEPPSFGLPGPELRLQDRAARLEVGALLGERATGLGDRLEFGLQIGYALGLGLLLAQVDAGLVAQARLELLELAQQGLGRLGRRRGDLLAAGLGGLQALQ